MDDFRSVGAEVWQLAVIYSVTLLTAGFAIGFVARWLGFR